MIKLLVSSGTRSPVTHSFNQPAIIIGSAPSPDAELSFPSSSLEACHLKITEEEGAFYAVNVANDPFAAINNLPFGKKQLYPNDIIELDDITIRFIGSLTTTEETPPLETIDIDALVRQVELLGKKSPSCETPSSQPASLLSPIVQTLPNNSNHTVPLNETPPAAPPMGSTPSSSPISQLAATNLNIEQLVPEVKAAGLNPNLIKKSLKDYYLSEYDDVQDATQLPLNRNGRPAASKNLIDGSNWKLLLKIFSVCLVLAAIIAGLGYLWISDQSEEEEIKAGKSVADVAMALTYAQIKHIRPQNQNWSDPEFIRNNLTAVLASKHLSLAEFDTHGQLTNCPYLLRIYTSSDLSQFLVLAQPAPSVLQWLIPKATVVIDSNSMEMRKVNDLKTLNRLLATANTLDGTSAAEISQLVSEAPIIPLTDLVTPRENQGFSPPKALALMHPGAENLVYNAPRYYHLGDDLMKKSFDLIEKSAASHEVTLLQQEITALSKYPKMVFYASGGIRQATQGQKALAVIAPEDKFLFAYLKLTNKGKISSSHLLMDDASMGLVENELPDNDDANYASEAELTHEDVLDGSHSLELHSKQEPSKDHQLTASNDTDRGHPIYLQLAALSHARQQTLKPVSDEIIALINKNNSSPQAEFAAKFQALTEKYATVAEEQQNKAAQKIASLNDEHKKVPAVQFLEWVKAAGIETMFRSYLGWIKSQENFQEISRGVVDNQLSRIENSNSWEEMEKEVSNMANMLTFSQIPDSDRLITYQNATRSRVIQKLNQFLISSNCPLAPDAFDDSQRPVVSSILQTCWICDPETLDFYLSEFDQHSYSSSLPQGIGSKN